MAWMPHQVLWRSRRRALDYSFRRAVVYIINAAVLFDLNVGHRMNPAWIGYKAAKEANNACCGNVDAGMGTTVASY